MPNTLRTVGAEIPELSRFTRNGDFIEYGSRGKGVKLTQEWLTIHGFAAVPDGKFGPATERALFDFCLKDFPNIAIAGVVVNTHIWEALWAPMTGALSVVLSSKKVQKFHSDLAKQDEETAQETLSARVPEMALKFAKQHLAANACEIGRNQGPWVRLYMDADPVRGHDGPEYAWCGGFVRFCIQQALENLELEAAPSTVWRMQEGWSVDRVAEWATRHGKFHKNPSPEYVKPGSLFLVHRAGRDWTHIGFVEEYDHDRKIVKTVEGNTNVAGQREGIAVMRRYRAVKGLDFVEGYYGVPV